MPYGDIAPDCFNTVFQYFTTISAIPRASGNEAAIASFLEKFAADRGYFCIRDAHNNIFIRRPASPGYENHPPVILQGHMDMVCEANRDTIHNFLTDPIEVIQEGDILRANGTTLGADDGVAVAIMLALLDLPELSAPMLECIFTSEEETGLVGMRHFDASVVTGRRMINIDSAGEGMATVACAGGVRTELVLPYHTEPVLAGYTILEIRISGLSGGHSGEDIHLGQTPAIAAMGRMLYTLSMSCDLRLLSICGGTMDNAIPRECSSVIAVNDREKAITVLRETEAVLRGQMVEADRNFAVTIIDSIGSECCTDEDTKKLIGLIRILPLGIRAMSRHIPDLVETSSNLGIIKTGPDAFRLTLTSRSSIESSLDDMEAILENCALLAGASCTHKNRYPGWSFNSDSCLQRLYLDTWKELYGTEAKIIGIHAGLECGLLLQKIPGLDAISIGPDVRNLHSPSETCTVSSFERLYRLILVMLEKM